MIPAGEVFARLLAHHGPQHWWPATDRFEIIAGALLVQRTAWRNAEAALAGLRRAGLLDPSAIAAAPIAEIQDCVRPAGFFRSKASRLQRLGEFLRCESRLEQLAATATPSLRQTLLALEGIGPETADVILLYAFGRPAVVVDQYLRRFVGRLGRSSAPPDDSALRAWVARDLPDAGRLNEFHALVVAHGKAHCAQRALCEDCALSIDCRSSRRNSESELGEGVGDVAQDA